MSRTDAHAPLHVRLARGELPAEANHCCAGGTDCDLPARPGFDDPNATRCGWRYRYCGVGVCACELCHSTYWRRNDNRCVRHRVRAALAAVRRAADRDEE